MLRALLVGDTPLPFRPSPVLVLLILLNTAAATDRMVFGALAPVLADALHLDDRQLALVVGPAFGVPNAVALPFAGWLVDRVGARRALVGSVVVWTTGMIVAAAATSLPLLLAGRGITGVGQAALTPAAFSLILAAAAPGRTGRNLSLFTGAGTLGRGFAFLSAGGLLALFGAIDGLAPWSATLVALAAGNILCLVAGARHLRGGVRGQPAAWSALGHWLRAAPLAIGAAVASALGTVVIAQALAAWIAVVLVRSHAAAPAEAALLIGAIGVVAGPLSHVAGGALADRRRGNVLGTALPILAAPLAYAVAAAPTLPVALAMLALVLLVTGMGGMVGLVRVQRLIPEVARGTANGLFMTLVALVGISGGPLLVPLLSPDVGRGLTLTVLAGALLAVVAGFLADHAARRAKP